MPVLEESNANLGGSACTWGGTHRRGESKTGFSALVSLWASYALNQNIFKHIQWWDSLSTHIKATR